MKLNIYFKKIVFAILSLSLVFFVACKDGKKEKANEEESKVVVEKSPFFKLSLAQWSFHKAIRDDKTMDVYDFAKKAKELGFEGVEYVSQLYKLEEGNEQASLDSIVAQLKSHSEANNIQNVLIMIDHEGDLAVNDKAERDEAVRKHKMWIDAAAKLGCSSVRVNLFGGEAEKDAAQWHANSVDGLGRLAAYAATKGLNVIVENHGGRSSEADKVVAVLKEINYNNCGALPDFGNFCYARDTGDRWGGECTGQYDIYKGVAELMPYAKGVSAKAFDFDENGNETTIDYERMLKIIKDSGFKGFIGVEYEGNNLGEEEGVIATRDLLLKSAKTIE
ncbi:Sugar phosphate isomerase/epimerase [Flaviramulus basaltis]|uniref:Sugar phosphate isomerase/epimerase n=1 Tax=Flaviramulus basaltis TaxID=369401 RepID=A0A1K2IER9_9FLAO|nr:sugar phosphate isomerase/epimerase family protein [Flaviramulus basaltis]SFZ90925.1 Sugar phosphate isomerase/epimerase [Flaviramulus basaltis]